MPEHINEHLVSIHKRIKITRLITLVIVVLIILILNIGLFLIFYKRISNYINGPASISIADLEKLNEVKTGFNPYDFDNSYFRINFKENDEYFADYFFSEYQWGSENEDGSDFKPDYNFVFVLVNDLKTKKTYVFHATVSVTEENNLLTKAQEYIDFSIENFNSSAKNYLYSQTDLLSEATKEKVFDNTATGNYYEKTYQFLQKQFSNKAINTAVVLKINPNQDAQGAYIAIAIVLIIEALVVLILLYSAARIFLIPLEKSIKDQIGEESFKKLNLELDKDFKEFSNRLKTVSMYLTDSFFVHSTGTIVPLERIKTYRKFSFYMYVFIRVSVSLQIQYANNKGKVITKNFAAANNKMVEEVLNLIQEKLKTLNITKDGAKIS